MIELGRYAFDILLAFGISLGLIASLVAQSAWSSRRIRRRLEGEERR
jgi:heme exporter protein D